MAKRQITLEDLANKIDGVEGGLIKKIDGVEGGLINKIDGVEKNLSKKIEDEVGGLAVMSKRSFDKNFSDADKMKLEMVEMRVENKRHFSHLEQGQEDLKLRQDNVAYRFELNAMGERVTKLEKTHQSH